MFRRSFLGLVVAAPFAALAGKQIKLPDEPDTISWFLTKRYNELMRGTSMLGKTVTIKLNERWFNRFESELQSLQRFNVNAAAKHHRLQPLKFKTADLYMDKTLGYNQWRMYING